MNKPAIAAPLCVGPLITSEMHRRDARLLLLESGWTYLGGGSFAAVFESPCETRAVRIGKPDLGYAAIVKAALEHPDNEHLARVYGHVSLSCGGMATEMEVLDGCTYGDRFHTQSGRVYRQLEASGDLEAEDVSLHEAFKLLASYMGPGDDERPSCWDVHSGNVMHRGDVTVLTDVLFDERNWELAKEQDSERRYGGTRHTLGALSDELAARAA